METPREIVEKSTSKQLSDIWGGLSRNQRRFVVAMQEHPTKKDAALSIGLEPNTVYGWNGAVDEAVELFSNDVGLAAYAIIESSGIKAAAIKAAGLDSDSERVRQDVSSELLDRILGKPTQRQEVTCNDGGALRVQWIDYGLDSDHDSD